MPATELKLDRTPAQLSPEQIVSFQHNGFLAFTDFLTESEVRDLNVDMQGMARRLYDRAKGRELPVKYGNWDNMRNYAGLLLQENDGKHGILLEADSPFDLDRSTFEVLDETYRKISFPTRASAAFKALAEAPKLIRLLEQLLGPGPILYGDQALCKPAHIGSHKPWHQDSAYFKYEPFEAGVDVWIALDDAQIENGCMYVLPGGHKPGPRRHIHRDDCTIADERIDVSQGVPVELRAGGIILFSVMLPHYTPPNRSAQRRRALQLFYRAAHTRLVSEEEHQRAFVEADGTPAACAQVKG